MGTTLLIIYVSILFLASLLVIFNAPTYFLWKVSIAVTEFGNLIFIILIFPVCILFCFQKHISVEAIYLLIASVFLLSYPIFSAFKIKKTISKKLKLAFEKEIALSSKIISLKKYFFGTPVNEVSIKTITYSTKDEKNLQLDFYDCSSLTPSPCVVVIHGGSWNSGDNKQISGLNHRLAKKGFQVAAINYRLAPENKFPAAIEDTKEAIDFLKRNAQELNMNSSNLFLLGRSSGGEIALLTAYTKKDENIKGVISFYAPADMVWGYSLPGNPLVMDSRKVLEDYIGGTFAAREKDFFTSSPIEFLDAKTPPTLLIHGKKDVLVAYQHSTRLSKKLTENNIPHFLLSLPWATHGADFNPNGLSAQLSDYAIEHFLKSFA
ncbi:MAG: alpha/beta hydrolase [Bacteroidia bacterium]